MPKPVSHGRKGVPVAFVRLRGRNGRVREYEAIVDSAATYCVLPKVDAYALGYGEAIQDPSTSYITRPGNFITLASISGYINATLIKVDEVTLMGKALREVEFLAYDLPPETGFDVILGASFLSRASASVDMASMSTTVGE
ncbi:MAG TPA: aspartyl protease family protein [Conexivisphaerales archaeon]|nr:aspartyl protease family protein [Conexivisphaerales archaeon]